MLAVPLNAKVAANTAQHPMSNWRACPELDNDDGPQAPLSKAELAAAAHRKPEGEDGGGASAKEVRFHHLFNSDRSLGSVTLRRSLMNAHRKPEAEGAAATPPRTRELWRPSNFLL